MRRRVAFNAEFKTKVVLEPIRGEKGLMQAIHEYGIKDAVQLYWRQEFLGHTSEVYE
jgi:transposase-like protein